jgi:asparagine synthase (glutamine-hydrolysing)
MPDSPAATPTQPAPPVLAQGQPRFALAEERQLAKAGDQASAWRSLLQRSSSIDELANALAAVSGEFALGFIKANGRSVLATDRFGVRPVCWRLIEGKLHVASRVDELAALPPRAEVDQQAIFDYLFFHVIPSPGTVFRGVHRLPAGHMAVYEQGRFEVRRYWTPRFEEAAHADLPGLASQFKQLLYEAVAAQLDGGKNACFLSGGTDSSTVAGMIGQVAGQPAATYSIGFEAAGYDEMEFARIAARHFGTEHHEYYVTPGDLVSGIAGVATHYDQPFGNSSALPAYYCARMAREDGVTRLLAGDGGDELFGGNSRYATQRVFGFYERVPESLRRGLLEPVLERSAVGTWPLAKKGRSYIQQAKVPLPDRMQLYNLVLRLGVDEIFEPSFLAHIDRDAPVRLQREVWGQVREGSALNRTLAYDWRFTLAEADLPKVCGTTALAGTGVGFPFLDAALVDFSLALPTDYKLRGLKLRWFFKEALRGFLPDAVITKKKQGFGLPFGVWATQHEALGRFAADSLNSLATRGVVRPAFIRSLLDQRLREHPGYYGEMVWILMMLEQWLRGHEPNYRLG